MVDEILFETRNLTYAYGNNKASIKDVNLKIRKGVKTALLGANGAGKSTLFYHLNGVLRPKEGEVSYNGVPLSYDREDLKRLRSDVSVVLQNPDDQIFSATVEEDVAFGLLNMGMSHDDVDRRIDEVLFTVGLSEYRMRPTQQLSYGQRKRVAFAGAIATRPKVLILDEPTAGLDPQMSQEILEIADQLHNAGTDVVISTHDVDLAYEWADEMHVMRNGLLVYSGDSEGFYSDPVKVYMSGLIQPSVYVMNSSLSAVKAGDEKPYPRTRSQLLSKMCTSDEDIGRMYTMDVDGSLDGDVLKGIIGMAGDGASVGVLGTESRRLAYDSGLRLDYVFSGLENCILDILKGHNAVLIHDHDMGSLVKRKIDMMRVFGCDIHIEGE